MGTHEVELCGWVVRRHKKVALILVGRGVCPRWLGGRCQALEVELVGIPLPMDFCHDVFVVIIS